MPLHQLRGMPVSDLTLYQRYTARRRFPSRRVELLLAQVPAVLSRLQGHDTRTTDFLFDEVPSDDDATAVDADAVAAAMKFTPRKRPPRQDTGDTTDGQQTG